MTTFHRILVVRLKRNFQQELCLKDIRNKSRIPANHKWWLIMKTCQCNIYPLEPHFYIAKLGYAGVYLFFLFLLQNIDCGYSLEPPRRMYVLSKNKKKYQFFPVKIFVLTTKFFSVYCKGIFFVMNANDGHTQYKKIKHKSMTTLAYS